MSDQQNNDKIPVGGMWLNESRGGKKYMSGNFGGFKILLFKNENKTSENQPDYNMYFAVNQRRDREASPAPQQQGGYQNTQGQAPGGPPQPSQFGAQSIPGPSGPPPTSFEDDVPF